MIFSLVEPYETFALYSLYIIAMHVFMYDV